jgi:hypothetical protein
MPNSILTDPNQLAMYRCLTCKFSCDKREDLDCHVVSSSHITNMNSNKRSLNSDCEDSPNDDGVSTESISAVKRIKTNSTESAAISSSNNTNTISSSSNTNTISSSSINSSSNSSSSSSSSNSAITVTSSVPMVVTNNSDIITKVISNTNENNSNNNNSTTINNIATPTTGNKIVTTISNISKHESGLVNNTSKSLQLRNSDIQSAYSVIDSALENSSFDPLSSSSSSSSLNSNSSNINNNLIRYDGFDMVTNSAGHEVIVTKDIEQAIILPASISGRKVKENQVLHQLQQQQRKQDIENKSKFDFKENDFNEQM